MTREEAEALIGQVRETVQQQQGRSRGWKHGARRRRGAEVERTKTPPFWANAHKPTRAPQERAKRAPQDHHGRRRSVPPRIKAEHP